MRKNIKYYGIAALAVLSLAACDKFLDKNPDNRTEVDTAEKAISLVGAAYSTTGYTCVTELMSDNFDDYSIQYTKTSRFRDEVWNWKDVSESNNESPENIWGNFYLAIANANQAIEAMDEMGLGDNAALIEAYGEALICRAYAHFMLVNIFSMQYNEKTSSTDLGVPYITEPEKSFRPEYQRGTVAEVYEKIEADLEKGLTMVGDSHLKVPKYHFNRAASYAFATRFYLYYGKYEKAIAAANQCLGAAPETVLRDYDVYGTMPSTANLRAQRYVSSEDGANLLLMTAYSQQYALWLNYTTQTRYNHGAYLATTEDIKAKQIYGAWVNSTDHPFLGKDAPHTFSGSFDRVMFYRVPYLFQYTDPVAGTGYSRSIYPAFTTDECLLNRAEAKILLNDFDGAAADLNLFIHNFTICQTDFTPADIQKFYNGVNYATWDSGTVKKEFHPAFDIGENGGVKECMLQCVVNLRRMENMGFGLRWFDIKRYGITIYRRYMNTAGLPDHTTDVMMAGDPRLAVQIPQKVRDAGLEPNPRNN